MRKAQWSRGVGINALPRAISRASTFAVAASSQLAEQIAHPRLRTLPARLQQETLLSMSWVVSGLGVLKTCKSLSCSALTTGAQAVERLAASAVNAGSPPSMTRRLTISEVADSQRLGPSSTRGFAGSSAIVRPSAVRASIGDSSAVGHTPCRAVAADIVRTPSSASRRVRRVASASRRTPRISVADERASSSSEAEEAGLALASPTASGSETTVCDAAGLQRAGQESDGKRPRRSNTSHRPTTAPYKPPTEPASGSGARVVSTPGSPSCDGNLKV